MKNAPEERDLSKKHEGKCSMCGQPSLDVICDACKAKVQGEALDTKHTIDKEGRTDTGRR